MGLQDDYWNKQVTLKKYFNPILNIVYETMPRDNLLNSACLELFEFIKRENLKPLIMHLVENCRPRLQEITYVDTFQNLILRYDQMQGFNADADTTLFSNEGTTSPNRIPAINGNRWVGVKDMDAAEEAYFNTSDDEEDEASPKSRRLHRNREDVLTNGVTSSPLLRSLVDYPDDEDDLATLDTAPSSSTSPSPIDTPSTTSNEGAAKLSPSPMLQTPPPERLSEKRRREEDNDEDELGKLSTTKRRNSGSSVSSVSSNNSNNASGTLKRKKGGFLSSKKDANDLPMGDVKVKKIEISIGARTTAASDQGAKGDDGG